MKTRLLFVAALGVLAPLAAQAQPFARRSVAAGEVTGLEMGIEGDLHAVPGGVVRWFVTLHEVVRRRELRPSAGSTLLVTASHAPNAPVATARTDERGRADLTIPIPSPLERAPRVRVEARSPRGVRRVFRVTLEPAARHDVQLFVDRAEAPVGSTAAILGRVMDRATGRPAAEVAVRVHAEADGPLAPPTALVTDAQGAFFARVPLGDEPRVVTVSARTDEGRATRTISVSALETPPLWLEARAEPAVARPGQEVTISLRVRDRDGRPVVAARATLDDEIARDDDDEELPRTDAAGAARLTFRVPATIEGRLATLSPPLTVVHPAHGSVRARVPVRVSRTPVLVGWAVDGGALAPELPARVHVRAVRADGSPIAGEPVTLEASRLGGRLTATTDAEGVASFAAVAAVADAPDGCGGPTATEAVLVVAGRRERLCLAVDPDATVAVELDARPPERRFEVSVRRRPSVRDAAVEVVALERRLGRWSPVARGLVPPRQERVELELPPEAAGEVWLRARPLLASEGAARGGGRLVFLGPRAELGVEADAAGARVRPADARSTSAVLAVESDAADAFDRRLDDQLGPVAAAVARGSGAPLVAALLASRTPLDVAAPVVLRDRVALAAPMPSDPLAHGLLRDPFRTRARFVRGRVGRLMRAVEDYVDARIPDEMAEVAVQERGRWRFNHAILEAALAHAGLGDETAAALDGEPLDIASLQAMDPAFDFDGVARRITRRRLFRVLVMLREHARQRGLDRPWARRGDPAEYPVTLLDGGGDFAHEWPERAHLFDGWGRPLSLRPARGRARFDFLEPVAGWELVSAGPDGRPGTRDDLVNPFSRVLPSGGLYAEAVGEDELLARLGGVALSRATVESLASVFDVPMPAAVGAEASDRPNGWGALPGAPPGATSVAPTPAPRASLGGLGGAPRWRPPPERRRYAAIAIRFDADATVSTARAGFDAGLPWAARVSIPETMRPGERLSLPLTLVPLAPAAAPRVEVAVDSDAVRASLGDSELRVEARRPGVATVTVRVSSGDASESIDHRVRVVPLGTLHARHTAAIAAPTATLSLTIPDRATAWRGEVVVRAPRSLASDPLLEDARRRHPALFAWARVIAGHPPDAEEDARVARDARRGRLDGALELACALVAAAAVEEPDAAERRAMAAAAARLPQAIPEDLVTRAAVLAALAASTPGVPDGDADPIAHTATTLRAEGWRALAEARGDAALMARVAAALLLADRADAAGRALAERASAALETDPDGRRFLPAGERPGDALVGTLALAVAARQAGDDDLADELARAAATRLHLVPRLGGDAIFWALAASVYGAFGVVEPTSVRVAVDGRERRVRLRGGAATVPARPGSTVVVTSERPAWVRAESRYLLPIRRTVAGPLSVRLEGDVGRLGRRAGLELVVEATGGDPVPAPVVEVQLPGAARLDDRARATLSRSDAVARVSPPDGAGVVRVHLAPLAGGGAHRVPLPLSWIGRGRTLGLSLTAYEASTPWNASVTPGRRLDIEAEAP